MSDQPSSDLWARIASLDTSGCTWHFARVGEPRRWQIVIKKDDDSIVVEDVVMSQALTNALKQAEDRGWA